MDLSKFYNQKKVLITGGMGFIGSSIAHRLVGYGANVCLVDSLIPMYGGNLFNLDGIVDKVHVNISDIRDSYSMSYLVRKQDILFNMAGTLSHIDSMQDPVTDLEINCLSQLKLLETCRRENPDVRIVFAGTRGQYGRAKHLPVNEAHPMDPIDVNGINNVASESYHLLYSKYHGIRASSVRLTNTYGPRHQMRHSRQGFLNWFIRLAMDDEDIILYDDGTPLRDFNYVDDVVEALLRVAVSEKTVGEVYNLGSGKPVSVKQAAQGVIEAVGRGLFKSIAYPSDKKAIEIGDYYADFQKIQRAVDWEPTVTLSDGLKRTVAFYRQFKKHYW